LNVWNFWLDFFIFFFTFIYCPRNVRAGSSRGWKEGERIAAGTGRKSLI